MPTPGWALRRSTPAPACESALRAAGVDEVHEGVGRTGVVGVIHGQRRSSGSMIGLRADMDALPMTEHNDLPEVRQERPDARLRPRRLTTMLVGGALSGGHAAV